MILTIKNKAISTAEVLHRKIFGQEMGEEMRKFIKNIGWMTIGTFVSMVFLFMVNLMAGRWLGPEEYGKYALAISIGQLFIIPMTLGLNTSVIRYLSSDDDKKNIIHTARILFIFFIFLASIFLLLSRDSLGDLLGIESNLYLFALLYSIFLSIRYFNEAILKGFQWFKKIATFNVVSAMIIFCFFFGYILVSGDFTFRSYLLATIAGLAAFSICSLLVNKNFSGLFRKSVVKKLMHYGAYSVLGALSGFALNNADKLILNSLLGTSLVGIFAAYASASNFLSGQVLQIFVDVFFPSVSAAKNKEGVLVKLKRIFYVSSIPLFFINVLIIGIIIKLYGAKYEFSYIYVVMFAILSVFLLFQNIIWWFIASFGKRGIRFTSTSGIVGGVANIVLLFLLIPYLGIVGAVVSSIVARIILIIGALIYLDKNNEIDG